MQGVSGILEEFGVAFGVAIRSKTPTMVAGLELAYIGIDFCVNGISDVKCYLVPDATASRKEQTTLQKALVERIGPLLPDRSLNILRDDDNLRFLDLSFSVSLLSGNPDARQRLVFRTENGNSVHLLERVVSLTGWTNQLSGILQVSDLIQSKLDSRRCPLHLVGVTVEDGDIEELKVYFLAWTFSDPNCIEGVNDWNRNMRLLRCLLPTLGLQAHWGTLARCSVRIQHLGGRIELLGCNYYRDRTSLFKVYYWFPFDCDLPRLIELNREVCKFLGYPPGTTDDVFRFFGEKGFRARCLALAMDRTGNLALKLYFQSEFFSQRRSAPPSRVAL